MLPILSTAMAQPASLHQRTKRSRPSRSKSLSARRQLPPATPGPIFAISIRLSHRRSPFTRSEEHTSELQSLMRISYAVFCLKERQSYHHHNIIYKPQKLSRPHTTTESTIKYQY